MPDLREQLQASLGTTYSLERELSGGGMSRVFVAREAALDRLVVVKVLPPEMGAAVSAERFKREIAVAARLQHPHIVPVLAAGDIDGVPYYTMPFVDGESLRARLAREGELSIADAVAILREVARALVYAHDRGIVHRDVKPDNVLLSGGSVMVTDFGVAKALSASTSGGATPLTQMGVAIGTPAYMAPEQAAAEPTVDHRADIYAFGCMAYELITGQTPFAGRPGPSQLAAQVTETPDPIGKRRPNIPTLLAALVMQCLEKRAADRPRDAQELLRALDAVVLTPAGTATAGIRVHDANAPLGKRSWYERLRDPVVIGLAALSVGLASLMAWPARDRADEGDAPVRFPLVVGLDEEMDANAQYSISVDGRLIAHTVRNSTATRIYLRDLGQVDSRPIAGTEGALQPFFSPDGQWIGFVSRDGRLRKVRTGGGTVIDLAEIPNYQTRRSALTPDRVTSGTWVADTSIVLSADGRLFVASASGGAPRPLMPVDSANGEVGQRFPRALGDGRTFLFLSWRGGLAGSPIAVASLDGRRLATLDVTGAEPLGVVDGHLIYLRAGVLTAAPFDEKSYRLGQPVVLEEATRTRGVLRAAVSPSGVLVYRTRGALHQIMRVGTGGDSRILIGDVRTYGAPRFSRDGARVALGILSTLSAGNVTSSATQDIWIYDLASGTPTQVTSGGSINQRPVWTRDGQRVLFVSNRGGRNELWWQRADLSDTAQRLETLENGDVDAGILTRDSVLIYSVSSPNQQGDIWYRRLSGDTTRKRIATSGVAEVAPALSADEKWLAYVSNDDDGAQVYVQPFPPTGVRHKVTAAGGAAPVWAPDGRHIYYITGGQLHAAAVRLTPSFAVLSRGELFERSIEYDILSPTHAFYDISPDGKHFAMLRPVNRDGARLVAVYGLKQALREASRDSKAATR